MNTTTMAKTDKKPSTRKERDERRKRKNHAEAARRSRQKKKLQKLSGVLPEQNKISLPSEKKVKKLEQQRESQKLYQRKKRP